MLEPMVWELGWALALAWEGQALARVLAESEGSEGMAH